VPQQVAEVVPPVDGEDHDIGVQLLHPLSDAQALLIRAVAHHSRIDHLDAVAAAEVALQPLYEGVLERRKLRLDERIAVDGDPPPRLGAQLVAPEAEAIDLHENLLASVGRASNEDLGEDGTNR
jgi:hypothetical protein